MIISTYWGEGEYKDRIAHVCKNEEGFYVGNVLIKNNGNNNMNVK